jgi:hypothetical protein
MSIFVRHSPPAEQRTWGVCAKYFANIRRDTHLRLSINRGSISRSDHIGSNSPIRADRIDGKDGEKRRPRRIRRRRESRPEVTFPPERRRAALLFLAANSPRIASPLRSARLRAGVAFVFSRRCRPGSGARSRDRGRWGALKREKE